MSNQQFNNYLQPADRGGCAFYRMWSPYWAIRSALRNTNFIETNKFVVDTNFFRSMRHVMVQRQVDDAQHDYFLKFITPLSKVYGFWTSYNIDDAVGKNTIPKYNKAWPHYQEDRFQQNIKNMLGISDFIILTTETIKQYYVDEFGADPAKCLVIPNYIPRWWAGECFNIDKTMLNYKEHKSRPRIAFTSSTSHFDITGRNNGIDDFSHIIDFIASTTKKYEWCFIGNVPAQLQHLAAQGKITVYRGSDIMNFLREVSSKNFNLVVAPLQDNVFNRCKSNIKLIENWSLGIPCIAQDLPLYSDYTDLTFTDANSLQNQIDSVLQNPNKYKNTVLNGKNIVDNGDKNAPNGWWLEKNLAMWAKLFTLPQKSITVDMKDITKMVNDPKYAETQDLILKV